MNGLLVHSSDVAMQVFSQHLIPETERYIGTIAGLFHDIGKIRTLSTNSTSPSLYLDHENYTLEILAPHLHLLERKNKQFADTLRYFTSLLALSFLLFFMFIDMIYVEYVLNMYSLFTEKWFKIGIFMISVFFFLVSILDRNFSFTISGGMIYVTLGHHGMSKMEPP